MAGHHDSRQNIREYVRIVTGYLAKLKASSLYSRPPMLCLILDNYMYAMYLPIFHVGKTRLAGHRLEDGRKTRKLSLRIYVIIKGRNL